MVRVTNTQNEPRSYSLVLDTQQPGVSVRGVDQSFEIASNGDVVRPVVVLVAKEAFEGPFSMSVKVLEDDGSVIMGRPLEFIVPSLSLLK